MTEESSAGSLDKINEAERRRNMADAKVIFDSAMELARRGFDFNSFLLTVDPGVRERFLDYLKSNQESK